MSAPSVAIIVILMLGTLLYIIVRNKMGNLKKRLYGVCYSL